MLERCHTHPKTKQVEDAKDYKYCGNCRTLSWNKLVSFSERCKLHEKEENQDCLDCKNLIIQKLTYQVKYWKDAWAEQREATGKVNGSQKVQK